MAEVHTAYTGDATSLAEATKKAQEGINGVLESTDKAGASLGQLNQVVELATKAQKGLTVASAFLAQGTTAVTAAVKASTIAFLSSPLAPIAAAVIAVGVAYTYLASETSKANEKVEASAKAAGEATRALERLNAVKQSIGDKELLATGQATQADLDLRDALADVTGQYGPRIAAQEKAIAKAKAEGKETAQLESALGGLIEQQGKWLQAATRGVVLSEAKKKATEAEAEASKAAAKAESARQKAEAAVAKTLAENLATQRAMIAETKATADATQEQIEATQALTKQVRQLDETEEDRIAREFRETDALLQRQIAANQKLGISTATLEEARNRLREKTKDRFVELAKEEVDVQRAADKERATSAKESANAIAATFSDVLSGIGSIASEIQSRSTDALGETQSQLDNVREALDGLSSETVDAAKLSGRALVQAYLDGEVAAESLSSAQKKMIESELKAKKKALKEKEAAEKKAALISFRISQGVAIAQAIISTAQGVIGAFQLGPIAGAIAAVAIGAIGATQVGLIASQKPQLHDGGFLTSATKAPDEADVRMQRNEAMLTGQGRATFGDDMIRMANAGRLGSGSGSGTIVYKHRPFEYFLSDHIRTNGTLAKSLRRGDRVGHVNRGRR